MSVSFPARRMSQGLNRRRVVKGSPVPPLGSRYCSGRLQLWPRPTVLSGYAVAACRLGLVQTAVRGSQHRFHAAQAALIADADADGDPEIWMDRAPRMR